MLGELGQFALVMALCTAVIQSVVPLAGAALKVESWCAVAPASAQAQALFLAIAYACLTLAFIHHDFSLSYVAQNSNTALPTFYLISAVWGGHEGSILLWAVVLSGWTLAVACFSRTLPAAFRARVIAVMGMVSIGLLLFMLGPSNPFERLVPAALEGRDLNPLLQDPGMIIHPPLLYMGYVGLAVPFAFAVAALMDGRVDAAWTRWTRPWTTTAWLFLTLGIAIGSWWAYSELGWGGWWFWDPVENASFMPWLLATALIHSLAATEVRGAFRAWTVLLAIFGFSLSLLGTFLVRSGVLVSVHAFATDPSRGLFILLFLMVVVGGALALFAWRGARLSAHSDSDFFSRDTLLLVNNVLLVVASASILVGTLYPILLDGLNLGKISVGPPYFDRVFVPLVLPLVFLAGLGPLVRWRRDDWRRPLRRLWPLAVTCAALAVTGIALLAPSWSWLVACAISLSLWLFASTALAVVDRVRSPGPRVGLRSLKPAFIGMCLAHCGVAVAVVGVTLTSAWSVDKDVRMEVGESYDLLGRTISLIEMRQTKGPNYTALRAEIRIRNEDGTSATTLYPEKRFYHSQGQPMTESAIHITPLEDVYVAIGEGVGEDAYAVRVQSRPMVRWIWLGPIIMAIGGLVAISDRRYRRRATSAPKSPDNTANAFDDAQTAT